MRRRVGLLTMLSLLSAGTALAETSQPTIFAIRFNGVAAPSTQYAGPLPTSPTAIVTEALPVASDPADGRQAMMATLSDWLGRVYDGALARFNGDTPVVTGASPVRLAADPRAYQAAGIRADAQLSALGLNSKLGMRLGTQEVGQTLRLSRGCGRHWLPNSLAGDVAGGFGAVSGSVQGSWGTACAGGQAGWKLTAGMAALGTDNPTPNLGMEYRPKVGSLVADLTGLSAVRAQVADSSGSVGLEAPMPLIRIDRMRISADMSWQEQSGTTLKLATKLRF